MSTYASDSTDPPRLPLELVDRFDQLCDRFDAEWRAGRRPRIEAYLAGESEANRPWLLRELLAAELERRIKLGEHPRTSDYVERFAGVAPIVAALLEEVGLTDCGIPVGGSGADRFATGDEALNELSTLNSA